MVGFLAVREKGKMEQVAFLDQPLVTSLLSHSKNYSLLEIPNTASTRLGQATANKQSLYKLRFVILFFSSYFLYSYCLTELAPLISVSILWNKKDFNTLALCGSVYRRGDRVPA